MSSSDATAASDAADASDEDVVTLLTAPEWAQSIDDGADQQAMASDSAGNVIITGETSSLTMYFMKYDPFGNLLWSLHFPGTSNDGTGVQIDSADNILLVGVGDSPSFSVGGSVLGAGSFVAKFTPAGAHVWSKTLVPSTWDNAPRIVLTPGDGAIISGRFNGTSVPIAGGPPLTGNSAYAVKLASDGSVTWSEVLSGDTPTAGTPDNAGGAVFVEHGTMCSPGPNSIAHVTSTGTCTGVSIGDYLAYPTSVAVDPSGNTFVMMSRDPGSAGCSGDFAMSITKLDTSFTPSWTKCIQGGVYPQVTAGALMTDDAGVLTVAGSINGAPDASIDLGGGPQTNAGLFVVHYDNDGGYVGGRLWPMSSNVVPYLVSPAPTSDVYLLGNNGGAQANFGDGGLVYGVGFVARQSP